MSAGILLERRAEEHLARQEHDDELRRCRDVGIVALRAELREVRAHLARVLDEQRLPRRFVGRFERLQVGVERHLRVDDDVLAAGQPDDHVGTDASVVAVLLAVQRLLLLEVAVLEHPGELDDPLELKLAPASADAGTLERVDEAPRFGLQVLARRVERRDALHAAARRSRRGAARSPGSRGPRARASSGAARGDPRSLSSARRCRVVAWLRASRSRVSARSRNVRLLVFKRFRAERLKGFAQPDLGILVGPEPLGVHGSLLLNFVLKTRLRGPPGQPAEQGAQDRHR